MDGFQGCRASKRCREFHSLTFFPSSQLILIFSLRSSSSSVIILFFLSFFFLLFLSLSLSLLSKCDELCKLLCWEFLVQKERRNPDKFFKYTVIHTINSFFLSFSLSLSHSSRDGKEKERKKRRREEKQKMLF